MPSNNLTDEEMIQGLHRLADIVRGQLNENGDDINFDRAGVA